MSAAQSKLVALGACLVLLLSGALTHQHRDTGAVPEPVDAPLSLAAAAVPSAVRVAAVPRSPRECLAMRVLSNGCRYTSRGLPRCGALLGAAYGANRDPDAWERSMHHRLGVHRTYWGSGTASAVRQARVDVAHHRIAWMSFKAPYSWSAMADGRGDAWARHLARRLAHVGGPIWVAFHHEPEGDGDVRQWTRMQAHLAPIVRANAPNVAYSLVLTGWNQLYGPSKYSLAALWPTGTTIDLVGFDVYDKFGVVHSGRRTMERTDFVRDYFVKFQRFAQSRHVAWGLAETAHTHVSANRDPSWTLRTYRQLAAHGGVAFSYFNTTLHSSAPWQLVGAKARRYAMALRTSPTL